MQGSLQNCSPRPPHLTISPSNQKEDPTPLDPPCPSSVLLSKASSTGTHRHLVHMDRNNALAGHELLSVGHQLNRCRLIANQFSLTAETEGARNVVLSHKGQIFALQTIRSPPDACLQLSSRSCRWTEDGFVKQDSCSGGSVHAVCLPARLV